jgi:hypothetical protein
MENGMNTTIFPTRATEEMDDDLYGAAGMMQILEDAKILVRLYLDNIITLDDIKNDTDALNAPFYENVDTRHREAS